jgi:hypothetical protein
MITLSDDGCYWRGKRIERGRTCRGITRFPRKLSYARVTGKIGIGAAVTRRPLPHHRAYGSVHGGSSWLR